MKNMKRVFAAGLLTMVGLLGSAQAQEAADSIGAPQRAGRLTLGGYGEAVMSRNYYSDHFNRYSYPENHKDDGSHGRFDLPHVTINMGYDFGKGWTMGMEIEFEHGGTESAVEMDADESGEYEAEVEKGGEVALEQFWIQKSFLPALNVRAGEIIVPVGQLNAYHEPLNFFTVYRPEGERLMLPNTWHQVGLSVWGRWKAWRYEAQFLSGLDSERFGAECFVHYGATSPYEFKIANGYAGMLRVDNYSIRGLRVGVSGYVGNTFCNTLKTAGSSYDEVKGTLAIGTIDFSLNRWNWVIRGNADYAHLSDATRINTFNNTFPKHTSQDGSPSKHQPVAKNAVTAGIEAGYDVFSQIRSLRGKQQLHVFGRYEYFNSMASSPNATAYEWCDRHHMALGINYRPIKEIVVKAEYYKRFFHSQYNNEPAINVGIAYQGWFKLNVGKRQRNYDGEIHRLNQEINELHERLQRLESQQ